MIFRHLFPCLSCILVFIILTCSLVTKYYIITVSHNNTAARPETQQTVHRKQHVAVPIAYSFLVCIRRRERWGENEVKCYQPLQINNERNEAIFEGTGWVESLAGKGKQRETGQQNNATRVPKLETHDHKHFPVFCTRCSPSSYVNRLVQPDTMISGVICPPPKMNFK